MGKEAFKSMERRKANGDWDRFFKGRGIDIGCGNACLPGAEPWDKPQGDAHLLIGVERNAYDWVHSSHCLEHLTAPSVAIKAWWEVLRKGGYLIVTIPDWDLYEHKEWPSKFNSDHKFSFSLQRDANHVLWVPEFFENALSEEDYRVHRMQLNDAGYNYNDKTGRDQTAGVDGAQAEIEVIIQKL